MLDDLHHSMSERGVEIVEYEMRIRLGDSATRRRGEIMAEENVVEGKGGRGAMREVRDCERGGGAAMFVQ